MHRFAFARVVPRSFPLPHVLERGSLLHVPLVHRCLADRIGERADIAAGERAEGHRHVGRAKRGGTRGGNLVSERTREYRERVHVARLALVGAHPGRRVPFQVLDGAVPLPGRELDVRCRDVVLEVDEVLVEALVRVARRNRPHQADRRLLGDVDLGQRGAAALAEPARGGRGLAGLASLGQCERKHLRPVATTGGNQRLARLARHERALRLVECEPAPGLGEQMNRRVPPTGHAHEITLDPPAASRVARGRGVQRRDRDAGHRLRSPHVGHRMSGQQLDSPAPELRPPDIRQLRPGVHHRHPQPGVGEVDGRIVRCVVVGEDDRAGPRTHRVAVDVALRGRCQHHARPIIVPEDQRALVRPGREHDLPRPYLPQPLANAAVSRAIRQVVRAALDDREVVVVVVPEGRGARQHPHLFHRREVRLHGGDPLECRRVVDDLPGCKQMSPRLGSLVNHEHPRAGPSRRVRRRETARPGANHEHVAVRIRLVVAIEVRPRRRASESRSAANEILVPHPPLGRPHEGLVVEPRGNQGAEQTVYRPDIECQARPAVLARCGQALVNIDLGRPRIRLSSHAGAELNEGVGFLDPVGHHPARTVILEAAADQAHPVREKRGSEGVAGIAGVPLAVEGEIDGCPAIDVSAVRKPEPCARHRLLPGGRESLGGDSPMRYTAVISWVTVSRSTLNHRPQPAE